MGGHNITNLDQGLYELRVIRVTPKQTTETLEKIFPHGEIS